MVSFDFQQKKSGRFKNFAEENSKIPSSPEVKSATSKPADTTKTPETTVRTEASTSSATPETSSVSATVEKKGESSSTTGKLSEWSCFKLSLGKFSNSKILHHNYFIDTQRCQRSKGNTSVKHNAC